MMATRKESFKGKTVTVSGSGNVAQYAAEKSIELGAKVVTFSDSNGMIHDPAGISAEKLAYVMELKNIRRGRIRQYVEKYPQAEYSEDKNPWSIKCDIALPCATQNEISEEDARTLVKNGCFCVAEGANMPSEPGAIDVFLEHKIFYGPGKAANAGGVATSGLEMTQNSMRLSWSREDVYQRLIGIMKSIHESCVRHGKEGDFINYVKGANVAGFIKVADAMMDQGVV